MFQLLVYDCDANDPCNPQPRRPGELFYPHQNRTQFVHCSFSSHPSLPNPCFVQSCAVNTSWSQSARSCVLDPSLFAFENPDVIGGGGSTGANVNDTMEPTTTAAAAPPEVPIANRGMSMHVNESLVIFKHHLLDYVSFRIQLQLAKPMRTSSCRSY